MPSEKLEKLKHDQYVAERKLTAAKHKEKRLESEIKRLTRSERTHRLCTRAGMLETFLWSAIIKTESPSARKYGKIGLHEEEFRWRENTAKRNGRRR